MSIQVKVPMVGESISEVTIGSWIKKDGDWVETDEPICEIESEKASMEIPAEASGQLKILVREGETVPVGSVIAEIDTDAKAMPGKEEGKKSKITENEESRESEVDEEVVKQDVKMSHVAARMLKEAGIPPEKVSGSGPGGRIVKADAIKAIEELKSVPEEKKSSAGTTADMGEKPQAIPVSGDGRIARREKMTTLRKTIANKLLQAKHQTAMLTTFNEIDMSAVIELRRKYKDLFLEKYGIKLGFMSFFTRAATIALKEFPAVNAQIDGDEIVYFEYCDIGIAVSTDRGLIVPVIRNAEKLSLAEIEKEIARLAERARTGKITIDEMTGGTFSITNGGIFGSLLATPLINYPQTAILGMHAIQERPVARNGEIVIRPMMYVALSYDHRLIDGKESVSFLKRIKEIIEDPARLVLEI